MKAPSLFIIPLLVCFGFPSFAQDDLLDMLEEETKQELGGEPVQATFKTQKVINAHSTETVKKKTLDFRIAHRFGSVGTYKGHDLFGLDGSDDIRFSFDYGITENLQVGVGRSKVHELIDGSIKYRPITQTSDNKKPLSLVLLAQIGYTPEKDLNNVYTKGIHRLNYTYQVIIGRKFGSRVSLEVLPTLNHRNLVTEFVNPDNGAVETNNLFSLGAAGRFKITQRTAILIDYFYTFSEYRKNNSAIPFYNPLGLGVEIETGGHVFHITATNVSGIVEGNYLPSVTESWGGLGIKLGFNISRVFNIGKH